MQVVSFLICSKQKPWYKGTVIHSPLLKMPQQTKQWVLNAHPEGLPITTGPTPTFKLVETTLPDLEDGQALVKNVYFSNDPAQRGYIRKYEDPSRHYMTPVVPGDVMLSGAIAQVVEVKASHLKKGDYVLGATGGRWAQYAVEDAKGIQALAPLPNNLPITHYQGALGLPGFTAYHGLVDVGEVSKDDILVVSGAAGATGSMVVQIAKKMIGCKKVIGLAGGSKKCEWVKKLGADECIDYKRADWKEELDKAAAGANVYFDNVGGEILDFMLTRLQKHGRVIACGAISTYNNSENSKGLQNWFQIIITSLSIRVS